MQDVRIPEHLKLSKKQKDKMSIAENEPKAGGKSKIKIRPPALSKDKANIVNKNIDKFIDRNKLKNQNKDIKTIGTNSKLDNTVTETNVDKFEELNKTQESENLLKIKHENQNLINEYNTLLEANKKIFSQLKGDKDLIDQNNSFLENPMMFSNNDLYRTANTFNFSPTKEVATTSCATQACDDNLVEFRHKSGKCTIVYDDGSEYTGELRNGN